MLHHIIIATLLGITCCFSQKKLTLEDIWNGAFSPKYLKEIHHLTNGKQYSVFDYNSLTHETQIIAHSYTDSTQSKSLLSSKELPIPFFENYQFSKNETRVLLGAQLKSRYRYSKSGRYFCYNFSSKKLIPITNKQIISPQFSPDGHKIAYIFENNIYFLNLNTQQTTQVTADGELNKIINGLSDWVYEEEFELTNAFKWSNDSQKIAFLKFNETNVPEYSMPIYGTQNYTNQQKFKYPKAGENNSIVSLHIYDITKKNTSLIELSSISPYYITELNWNNNNLIIHSLNRKQNELYITSYSTIKKLTKILYSEKNNSYVNHQTNLSFLKDESFIITSEKEGFNHLYHYTKNGELKTKITKGNWEVTQFYGTSPSEQFLYYQSTENNSTERQVFKIKINGNQKTALTTKHGTNEASFNADFSIFIHTFSNTTTPFQYSLRYSNKQQKIRDLEQNKILLDKINTYQLPKKEISTIQINKNTLNSWILKPLHFDSSKKYPVLLYQYSGPGSQSVQNIWNNYNDYWHTLLTQKGYIVACIDGIGTGYQGSKFKKQTQFQLGKLEAEDQIAYAKHLKKLPFIDKERIGIWGWSFGGFTSLNAVLKSNTTFRAAIAVAPVTHWKFYDTIYTERFLSTPQENKIGYNENSPLNYANQLNSKLLLVHGTADDNVHLQNTLQMTSALTEANKDFDLALYTDKNHGIYGGNTRLHLYKKMTAFIINNL